MLCAVHSCCRLASSAFTKSRMVTSEQSRHIFSTSALLPHRSPLAHGLLAWTSSHDLLMKSSRARLALLVARKQMLFCLGEGIKTKDQITWGKAAAVFLFRDERNSRLLIRFRAVDEQLLTTSGVLGQERDFGTGAHNLLRATRNIMVRACTRFHGAPTPGKSFVKWGLFQPRRKIVIGLRWHQQLMRFFAQR